jgi:hypothetical protein
VFCQFVSLDIFYRLYILPFIIIIIIIIIVIIIIITIILVITLIQGIYNYIPETNHVSWYIVLQLFCIYNLCYM